MANFTLTGVLGSGKSVTAVWKAMQFLTEGKPLATNMDLWPENYLPPSSKATHVRLPDFPSADDFWNLGLGGSSPREDTFGAVILDELATFLNSRDWQGKARDKTIHFLRHIRKRRYHTFFLAQDIESLDKQARNALIEHVVSCRRLDRLSIPVIGGLLRLFGFSGKLPQVHFAVVKYGKDLHAPIVEKWKHRGNKFYDVYNTEQVFTDEEVRYIELEGYTYFTDPNDKKGTYPQKFKKIYPAEVTGSFTVLSPWHLKGRYMSFYQRNRFRIQAFCMLFLVLSLAWTWYQHKDVLSGPDKISANIPSPLSLPQTAQAQPLKSWLEEGAHFILITQAGDVLDSYHKLENAEGTYYRVGSTWYKRP